MSIHFQLLFWLELGEGVILSWLLQYLKEITLCNFYLAFRASFHRLIFSLFLNKRELEGRQRVILKFSSDVTIVCLFLRITCHILLILLNAFNHFTIPCLACYGIEIMWKKNISWITSYLFVFWYCVMLLFWFCFIHSSSMMRVLMFQWIFCILYLASIFSSFVLWFLCFFPRGMDK